MARLHFFVEGPTEQTFADTLLKRHLANFGVYMQKPVLITHARRKGSPQAAETIGLENIRFKCPHFKRWIERLENLGAKSVGEP